jgi:hypothetical protein
MGSHKKDPADWKIKRNRNGREHIENCSSGYAELYPLMQVHHILPVEVLADATIEDKLTSDEAVFVKKCLMMTDWNINASPNVVGMPVKRVYWEVTAQVGEWADWPCHLVDHNPYYNDEVIKDLSKMWRNMHGNAEECKIDGETIKGALEAKSKKWLRFLGSRAKRAGGVAHCWKNKETLADWYYPFSMADPPQPRQAPKDWAKLADDLKAYVQAIFEKL